MVKEAPKLYRAFCDGCGAMDHGLAQSSDQAIKNVMHRSRDKWKLSKDGLKLYCEKCADKFSV